MHDLPTLLLSSGDSVAMSHTATMPLVKLPAIILWIKQRTQKNAKHVAWILHCSIFVDHANNEITEYTINTTTVYHHTNVTWLNV